VPYEVQTPVFEGPFDLLLHLILQQQVDLYELSLSMIVDAYLAEIDKLDGLDLDVATEFLLIAATLIELKTRRLLPGDNDLDLDDELALWEERDLLLTRLVECKTFKDAAVALAVLSEDASRSFPRTVGLEDRFLDVAPDLLAGVTPQRLHDAFMRAVTPRPVPSVDLDHVAPISVSVTDAVEELLADLPTSGPVTFRVLTGQLVDKLAVVVRFLAVLELFKQGLVDLDQPGSFGELTITWIGGDLADADHGAWMRSLAVMDAYEG
jgi:segregation and condensation protein A